jgi:hypothetical protein
MKEIKVEKISNNENKFKTKLKDLKYLPSEPEAGQRLLLLGDDNKGIVTSLVKSVTILGETGYLVKTENSEYSITLTGEDENEVERSTGKQ